MALLELGRRAERERLDQVVQGREGSGRGQVLPKGGGGGGIELCVAVQPAYRLLGSGTVGGISRSLFSEG